MQLVIILLTIISIISFNLISVPNLDESKSNIIEKVSDIQQGDSALYYLNHGDFEKAKSFGLELLKKSDGKSDFHSVYANAILGQIEILGDNSESGYSRLKLAQEEAERMENDSALAIVCNGLALYHNYCLGDDVGAMHQYTRGLDYAKKARYDKFINIILSNIVNHCFNYGDPEVGKAYADICYRRGIEQRDTFAIYLGAVGLATMLNRQGDSKSALRYIAEAETCLHRSHINEENLLYAIYASILTDLGRYDEAEINIQRAIDHPTGRVSNTIDTYHRYAKLKLKTGDVQHAMSLLECALALCSDKTSRIVRADILRELAVLYNSQGDYKKAARLAIQAGEQYNIGYSKSHNRVLAEMRTKYLVEQTREENMKLRISEIETSRNVNYLIGGIGFVFLVALGLLILYTNKNRLYRTIVRQNTAIMKREEVLNGIIDDLRTKIKETEDKHKAKQSREYKDGKIQPVSIPENKVLEIVGRLESLMTHDKIYTDPLLNREQVAAMLHTNRTYLSNALNQRFKMTFSEYINSFRINEAIRMLSDPEFDIPLKALASMLGYGSINTFYNNFREVTGMPPKAYRQMSLSLSTDGPAKQRKTESAE